MRRIQLNADRLPSGILLGNFIGDDAMDLLACDCDPKRNKSTISCYRGNKANEGEHVQGLLPAAEPMPAMTELSGALVDWEVVHGGTEPQILIATEEKVRLFQLKSGSAMGGHTVPASSERILQATYGWARNRRADPFLVILDEEKLFTDRSPTRLLTTRGAQGRVGVHDLNNDGRDDVVFVEAVTSRLSVFVAQSGGSAMFDPTKALSFEYPGFHEPVDVGFLDANLDGKVDICFGSATGEVVVFLGNGEGSFSDARVGPLPAVLFAGPDLEALRVIDLDPDPRRKNELILASVSVPGLVALSLRPESPEKQ
jgi:hypothetical protein